MATPDLRPRRKPASQATEPIDTVSSHEKQEDVQLPDPDTLVSTRISVLDILRLVAGLLILNSTVSYFVTNDSIFWGYRPAITRPERVRAWFRGPLLLTDAELGLYNGTSPTLPIYLALNSTIYDVSASPHIYGPGGSYHFFAGRDATRAFVTGCFDEDLTPDLRGVEEMYVPLDLDKIPVFGEGVGEEERKRVRREWKVGRERAWRVGREMVRRTVAGWEGTFNGGKGGKYFMGGWLWRLEGWEVNGKRRRLCDKARDGRPKTWKEGA